MPEIAQCVPCLLHVVLLAWLTICAVQDWHYQEVSNWLTLPPFILALFYAWGQGGETLALTAVTLFVFLTTRAIWQAQGAADIKVLVVLASFWPHALYAALLMTGLWSLARILRRQGKIAYAGVPPMAIGTVFVLVLDLWPLISLFAR